MELTREEEGLRVVVELMEGTEAGSSGIIRHMWSRAS